MASAEQQRQSRGAQAAVVLCAGCVLTGAALFVAQRQYAHAGLSPYNNDYNVFKRSSDERRPEDHRSLYFDFFFTNFFFNNFFNNFFFNNFFFGGGSSFNFFDFFFFTDDDVGVTAGVTISVLLIGLGGVGFWWYKRQQHLNNMRGGTTTTATNPLAGPLAGPLATSTLMGVTAPPGSSPGDVVTIQTPDGRQYQVNIPDGVEPGQTFQVDVAAAAAATSSDADTFRSSNISQLSGVSGASQTSCAPPGGGGAGLMTSMGLGGGAGGGGGGGGGSLMEVTVPSGMGAGSKMTIQTPNGQQFEIIVPTGVSAGQTMQVQCPDTAEGIPEATAVY